MRPLGHRTHLATKVKGESSMLGKRRTGESVVAKVRSARLARHDERWNTQSPISRDVHAIRRCYRTLKTTTCCASPTSHWALTLRRSTGTLHSTTGAQRERLRRRKGHLQRATQMLGMEGGIPYGMRILWVRKPRSSRGSHAPPGRQEHGSQGEGPQGSKSKQPETEHSWRAGCSDKLPAQF